MLQDLSYKYYHKQGSKTVYLVLHGGGTGGIETPFVSSIMNVLTATGNSVFGFNFPYCERGEDNSSGPELAEETAALTGIVQYLRSEGYEKITIVSKSLGGIVASYWLAQNKADDIKVVVLGYVIGSVKTEALQRRLDLVIQGENDRFGNAQDVKDELAKYDVAAKIVEVSKADHSYRNEQKEPVYQEVVNLTTTQVETLFGELEYIEPRLKAMEVIERTDRVA
jgi:predicted alpha/beta-hydrolase family hydrolase